MQHKHACMVAGCSTALSRDVATATERVGLAADMPCYQAPYTCIVKRPVLIVGMVVAAAGLACALAGYAALQFASNYISDVEFEVGAPPPAVGKPVRAMWGRGNAATMPETAWKYRVQVPEHAVGARPVPQDLGDQLLHLDDRFDVHINGARSKGASFGILVNNGSRAERVLIDDFRASDCTDYGVYADGARDWWIRNSSFSLCKDANEHGIRIPYGERIRISDTVIDTRRADKTTLWILTGSSIELRNVKMLGGRNWFSFNPENTELGKGSVKGIVIADCWIDLDQDWANPLEFMPGVEDVEITNLHVRSARPPIGVWSSLNGVPAAKRVRWRDIWVPNPKQPPTTEFDDLEWILLPNDAWEQIIWSKNRTREELIADGHGPIVE